jgi:hypothetical protein
MQEPLHHAFAIVGGGFVGRALRDGEALPPGMRWAGWIVIALMILTRLSWSVLLLMWALAPGGSIPTIGRRLVLAAALALALVAAFFTIAAPIPNSPIAAGAFTAAGLQPIVSRVAENFARLGNPDDFESIELWHRAVYAAALFVAVGGFVVASRRRQAAAVRHAAVHVVNLGGITAAMFVLYAISNMTEIRIIAAHVLLGAAILVTYNSRAARILAACVVIANVAAVSIFWKDFRQNRDANFRRDLRSQRVLEETIEGRLVYQRGASPWCNTLLAAQYPPDFVAIPAGIGLSVLLDADRLDGPIKSRYVLLDDRTSDLAPTMTLERIGELPYGTLYENRSTSCR